MPASFIFIHDNWRWWQGVFVWGQTLLENNKTNSWPSAGKRHCGNNTVRKKTQRINNNKIPQQESRDWGENTRNGVFASSHIKKLGISGCFSSVPQSDKISLYRSWSLDVKLFLSLYECSLCNFKKQNNQKNPKKPSSLAVSSNLICAG